MHPARYFINVVQVVNYNNLIIVPITEYTEMRTVALWNFSTPKHVIKMGVGIEWKKNQ